MLPLPRGLYAITPDRADTDSLLNAVRSALAGGIGVLQYRNKQADAMLRRQQAEALLALCRPAGVPLVVNDDLALALAIDADGLHLGSEDGDLAAARAALGPARLLGASCYDRIELAASAIAAGASYVAFGAAYPSTTKPHAPHAPLALYRQAAASLSRPVVAIGGITVSNCAPLLAAGVHGVAVCNGLFDAPDIAARAMAFQDVTAGDASI
ncbi:thiamine phosphate synthase [Chitinimonas arctica]|uniref:Thiamine-phosphate synthase n=2 Tax=Chitinimonas arctica TaxID=2594795 RepID=A0A516SMB8_9NEIS|nr:thiamine phosphate synthase [Chitinimonas arctica]